jgi:predicted 2-oxoglutarate/Fe(II)-dependent dioxygenase YbiX
MKLYEPFQFLTTEECIRIIEYGKKNVIKEGTLIGAQNDQIRNNRVVWYKDSSKWTEWIKIFNNIENKIDWIQDPQISFYKPGEKYNWHNDQSPSYRTHQRYFTLTCELQTGKGSQFELKGRNLRPMKVGEAVIFHSTDIHRATTPISGERISFTIWAMAKNYHRP